MRETQSSLKAVELTEDGEAAIGLPLQDAAEQIKAKRAEERAARRARFEQEKQRILETNLAAAAESANLKESPQRSPKRSPSKRSLLKDPGSESASGRCPHVCVCVSLCGRYEHGQLGAEDRGLIWAVKSAHGVCIMASVHGCLQVRRMLRSRRSINGCSSRRPRCRSRNDSESTTRPSAPPPAPAVC